MPTPQPIPTAGSRLRCRVAAMIYSVVPPQLEPELFDKLTEHYAENPDVTVIVDRRRSERRTQRASAEVAQKRVLRDRRRRRAAGEFAALPGEPPLNSEA